MNKKLVFSVLALSIVAALLTIAQGSPMMRDTDAVSVASEPSMGMKGMAIEGAPAPMGYSTEQSLPVMAKGGMMIDSYMPYPGNSGDALTVTDRVQEKYAYQGVVVRDVPAYLKEMKAYLTTVGGRVLSASQQTSRGMTYGTLLAKVPVESFDKVTTETTARVEKVADESINAQDVTGQQVSLDDRTEELKKLIVEKQTQIAAARTDAEKKRIQYELDSLQKQVQMLEKSRAQFQERVQFATVSLTAADTVRFFDPTADLSLWDETKEAIRSMGGVSAVFVRFAIWIVVYAVIWLPLLLGARFVWNRLSHKV